MRARRLAAAGAVAAAVLAAAVVPGEARATHRQDPPRILLQARGETQRAVQGTFCVMAPPHDGDTREVLRCVDYVEWDPRRFTAVRRNGLIRIVVKNAIAAEGEVLVRRLNAEETIVRRLSFTNPVRRVRVRLPSGRFELDVRVYSFEMPDGRFGDTAAALGLRVLSARRPSPPDLTGRRFGDIANPF